MRTKALIVVLGLLAVVPVTAVAQDTTVARENVHGIAFGYAGDCPDELPALPMVCTEWVIQPFDATFVVGGGGVASQGWKLNLLHHTLTFPGGDGEPEESDVAFAQVPVSDVTFDGPHLSYASVRATGITLSDGTTANVDVRWEATSERFLYGNDGPAVAALIGVRHVNEDCLKANYQAHQKFRTARMEATVNGVHYTYDGLFAYIAFNHFVFKETIPSRCT